MKTKNVSYFFDAIIFERTKFLELQGYLNTDDWVLALPVRTYANLADWAKTYSNDYLLFQIHYQRC